MVSILLASAGAAIGGSIGGAVLGVSAATIGGAIGSFAGSMIDSWIVSSLAPGQRIEGQRLENLTLTTSTEGAVIPRIYGRMRIGGNIIWATDFTETVNTTTQGGGKGGGPKVPTRSARIASRFDMGNELLVDLTSGTLASVTDIELFAGANTLAIQSTAGIWEIVQFGNATLVATGRYSLTRLLRGQRGTEDARGNPTLAGAKIVLLDAAVQPLSLSLTDLGIAWNWRIGPASAAPSDPLMQALTFAPNGRGLMPFAPTQARMRRLANGDLALRWLRRDRALAADSWVLIDVPLSETAEAYDLEILNGGTVARTITGLNAPSFTYTSAMQTADFGSPVASLAIRLSQIGALGRGVPLSTTLTTTESL